jgi:hypothetical protein
MTVDEKTFLIRENKIVNKPCTTIECFAINTHNRKHEIIKNPNITFQMLSKPIYKNKNIV